MRLKKKLTMLWQSRAAGDSTWRLRFPILFCLTAHRIYQAANKPDKAVEMLNSGRQMLLERADKIDDPILRAAYLKKVLVNKQLLAELEPVLVQENPSNS